MSINQNQNFPINKLAEHIDALNKAFDALLHVMEQQIDAIIKGDTEMVEELTEKHSGISSEFKKCEKGFLTELENIMKNHRKEPVSLTGLKNMYPESASVIEVWRESLSAISNKLQNKHLQVVQLLEFAMMQNATMMRSIYSMHNQKTSHYNPAGVKQNFASGMAVNQEV